MSDTDPIVQHGPFTEVEALRFLRTHAKGRALFVHAGVFLPTDATKGFETQAMVPVTRGVAETYVSDVLRNLGKRGARLRISMSAYCLFIGSSV